MSSKSKLILNVKTNIITGFLGVGKTTAITRLLSQKPQNERWAVLVNEFGEMGIDGHLLENNEASLTIKQVPGGCICCAAGLPLQVAVNQLLKQTHPDRLIIEPSGMGHPRNIIKSLTEDVYNNVIDMRACLCLVDPRKLNDTRYLESDLFIDQINVADIVVANKTDLCNKDDKKYFDTFMSQQPSNGETKWIEKGRLKLDWLNQPHYAFAQKDKINGTNKLEESFKKITLDYSRDTVFNLDELEKLLKTVKAERIKGILHTDKGYVIINHAEGLLKTEVTSKNNINRIEIISIDEIDKEALNLKMVSLLNISAP